MVSFCDYKIYLLFLLLVKFHGSGKCERILQCFFTMCHFRLRHLKRRPFISNVMFVKMISELQGVFQQFLFFNIRYDLGFQSRDKWSLNNYDAIWIKSKEFYASSVTIPYVQNLTSKLKLRSALFSWLVWVVFLAMRKVTALSGGAPLQKWWLNKPKKELPSVPKLPSLPSISHHWEEFLTIFPLIID